MARTDNKASYFEKVCCLIQDDQSFNRDLNLSSLIKRLLHFSSLFGLPSPWANELCSLIFTFMLCCKYLIVRQTQPVCENTP
jgi:hypothetical protein